MKNEINKREHRTRECVKLSVCIRVPGTKTRLSCALLMIVNALTACFFATACAGFGPTRPSCWKSSAAGFLTRACCSNPAMGEERTRYECRAFGFLSSAGAFGEVPAQDEKKTRMKRKKYQTATNITVSFHPSQHKVFFLK